MNSKFVHEKMEGMRISRTHILNVRRPKRSEDDLRIERLKKRKLELQTRVLQLRISYCPKTFEPSKPQFKLQSNSFNFSIWSKVLHEIKWMAIDFKEERKWKIAAAFHLSRRAKKAWKQRESYNVLKYQIHRLLSHSISISILSFWKTNSNSDDECRSELLSTSSKSFSRIKMKRFPDSSRFSLGKKNPIKSYIESFLLCYPLENEISLLKYKEEEMSSMEIIRRELQKWPKLYRQLLTEIFDIQSPSKTKQLNGVQNNDEKNEFRLNRKSERFKLFCSDDDPLAPLNGSPLFPSLKKVCQFYFDLGISRCWNI